MKSDFAWATVGIVLKASQGIALPLGAAFASVAVYQPNVLSHQTQISDGVGGTHHIEPSDTPKAGEPSQAWFALTQAGGTAIGLSDCDCELVLYGAGDEAIATPALSAIAVEGLTDVPSAELTFPQVGAYVLTLKGIPKGTADFPDFQLDFPITVAAGQATATPEAAATPEASPDAEVSQTAPQGEDGASGLPLLLPIGIFVVLATAAVLVWRGKQN